MVMSPSRLRCGNCLIRGRSDHVINLQIIGEGCAYWHRLVQRVNQLFARVAISTSRPLRCIDWTLRVISSKRHRLDRLLQSESPFVPFVDQMIGCSNVIVAIGLETLDRVVSLEVILLYYLPQEIIVEGHLLEARVKARLSVRGWRDLLEPGVLSDSRNGGSLLWVSVQDPRQ